MNRKILLVLLFLSLGILTGCGNTKKESKKVVKEENKEEKIKFEDQTVDVFSFKDAKFVEEDGKTKFSVTITNTSNEKQNLKEFRVHMKDSNNEVVQIITVYLCEWVEGNEVVNAWAKYEKVARKVTSLEYEIVK